MKNLLALSILFLLACSFGQAQVLGTGAVDTVHRTKNVVINEPKPELGNVGHNPDNGSSKNSSDKKVEDKPVLAPTGKPKLED